MSILAFIPVIIIGAVFSSVCAVSLAIRLAERARARHNAARPPRRKAFRPVIIQGGKPAPAAEIHQDEPGPAIRATKAAP